MSQKSIILIVVLFALIIAGMFVFAFLKKAEIETVTVTTDESEVVESVLYPEITRVDAKHYIDGNVHTLVGEINFPTPCDLLEAEGIIASQNPDRVRVDFTVINNADGCVQVETPQRFKVEVITEEEATYTATFMGRDIELNLIPAAEGESPDDFEIFIKG